MNKYLLLLLLLCWHLSISAQAFVGIRDNKYAFTGYSIKGMYVLAEHSLFSEKITLQHFRLLGGYNFQTKWSKFNLNAYGGGQWDKGYGDYGATIMADLLYDSPFSILVASNPHYDTGVGFSFCTKAGFSIDLKDEIQLFAQYSSIPEYRISEHRLRIGLLFKTDRLFVSPILSFPLEEEIRTTRVLVSFLYSFI